MSTIYRSTDSVSTKPATTTAGQTMGWFKHANPATNTLASPVTVDLMNYIVGNLGYLLDQKAITLNYDDMTQIYTATLASGWLTKTTADTFYVLKAGDTMTGLLTLSGNPSTNLHAVPKQYADTKLALSGGTMTGTLVLAADPSSAMHAASKQYVDNTTVSLSGDTMTGFLFLNADPTLPMHAATKSYVDSRPKPQFTRTSWTDHVDIATAPFNNVWNTVKSWSITPPSGASVVQISFRSTTHHVSYGWSCEYQILVNGVAVDWTQTNMTTSDNGVGIVVMGAVTSCTAGTPFTLTYQAKNHSNGGNLWTNGGQFTSSGDQAGGTSSIDFLYF